MNARPLNDKIYKKMLGPVLPRAVQDGAEYERVTEILRTLGEVEAERDLSPEEESLVGLLLTLTEAYEEQNQKSSSAGSPLEYLKAAMEHRGIKQVDLLPLLGSSGVTSEILSGKRQISKRQAFLLAEFFHVDVGLFLQDPRTERLGSSHVAEKNESLFSKDQRA